MLEPLPNAVESKLPFVSTISTFSCGKLSTAPDTNAAIPCTVLAPGI